MKDIRGIKGRKKEDTKKKVFRSSVLKNLFYKSRGITPQAIEEQGRRRISHQAYYFAISRMCVGASCSFVKKSKFEKYKGGKEGEKDIFI